jgi:hypothetical protein
MLIYEQMMLRLMQCKCQNTSLTPEVLHTWLSALPGATLDYRPCQGTRPPLPPCCITQPPPPGRYLWRTPHADELPFSQAARRCCDVLKTHVANVCFKCFRCFRGMLQVFHMDLSKLDRDVSYVASVSEACCKSLFKMFHLFLQAF